MWEMIGIEGRKDFGGPQSQSGETRLTAGGEEKTHRIRFVRFANIAEAVCSGELPIPLDEHLFGERMQSHLRHPFFSH